MPVRSLNSSVLKWPDFTTVDRAMRTWARKVATERRDIVRIGYFGSYARGDWGVGSDLDIVVVVEHSDEPFHKRSAAWDTTELPVPTDLLVYTRQEWEDLDPQGRFSITLQAEAVWVYARDTEDGDKT